MEDIDYESLSTNAGLAVRPNINIDDRDLSSGCRSIWGRKSLVHHQSSDIGKKEKISILKRKNGLKNKLCTGGCVLVLANCVKIVTIKR